jgi:hypothetical protein
MASDIADAKQNVAGQTGDNVVIGGATYTIATDWGSGGGTGFSAAHAQVVKTAWGDSDFTYRTTKLKPIPVQIFDGVQGTTGALIDPSVFALKITGDVSINQYVGISGGMVDAHNHRSVGGIIQIVGPTFGDSGPTAYAAGHVNESHFNPVKVTGAVHGYENAYPVGVTFTHGAIRKLYGGPIGYTGFTGYVRFESGVTTNSSILERDVDYIAIQGLSGGEAVGITAHDSNGLNIRNLSSRDAVHPAAWVKDSVAVEGFSGMTAIAVTGGIVISKQPHGGSFETRSLEAHRDSVAIYDAAGGTGPHVKLIGHDGTPIGISGGALKVAVDNGSFTANVTVTPEVEVKGTTGSTGIQVRGVTSQEIVVKGPLTGGALEVSSPSGLNVRTLTTTDQVSVGGQVATDVTNLKTNLSDLLSEVKTLKTDIANVNSNIEDVEAIVTNFQDNGTQTYYDNSGATSGIFFNTCVKKTVQPSELISITLSVSTNAKAVSTNREVNNGVYIQSNPTNTNNIVVGGSSLLNKGNLGFTLEPGESIFLQVSNLNLIYVKAQSGSQNVSCIGS